MPRSLTPFAAAAGVAVALAAPAATAAGQTRLSLCQVNSVSIAFSPTKVTIRSSRGELLATVTPKRSTIATSCSRVRGDIRTDRINLDSKDAARGKAVCPWAHPAVMIKTEPARNAVGRVVGSRVVVWMPSYQTEIAEGFLIGKRSWFKYATTACRPD